MSLRRLLWSAWPRARYVAESPVPSPSLAPVSRLLLVQRRGCNTQQGANANPRTNKQKDDDKTDVEMKQTGDDGTSAGNERQEGKQGIWVEQIDPGTGGTFYFHTKTMEHRDKMPEEFKYQDIDATELPPPGTKLVRGLDGKLWEKYVTQAPWDREYFFHRPTKSCTWDDPSKVPPEKMRIDDPDRPGPVAVMWERLKQKWKEQS